MNIKKASTLSGVLLARKGTATPSFLTQVHPPLNGLPATTAHRRPTSMPGDAARADTSNNDNTRYGRCGPDFDAGYGGTRDHHGRIKLSLRLDQERHLKLKLAAAHTDRHIQDILTAALDRYLNDLTPAVKSGGCTCYPTVSHPED